LTKQQIDGLAAISFAGQASLTLSLSAFHLENVQARDRSARILSALASAFGGVFTCNANKAEATVGYSTLYGDHGGFFAPLADLWKSEVYALGAYLNQVVYARAVIPAGIFTIKPSAELSSAQNPEQGGGDPILYAYHDKLFHAWQQAWNRSGPEEILAWYAQGILETKLQLAQPISTWFPTATAFIADLERWWKLFKGMGVVKRVQAPPLVALSRRAYGFDYRESILQPYWSRDYLRMKSEILGCG
jgi:NAD+ synthase (glutamine-hydrolysing)